ncbi:hypothetical protein [Ligilactobacillus equi]|uniref:Uncharacterized protein n=1 Tax=Ligilactobacillus equi DPC 6820 TaxID=1392007 RepID=V7HV58_9LACO|nr:hypothetical protein [Ligilactobacillus equi]ETA73777.1 hypothetical protein LEQ_0080c [Ligilactobacillus equi DPC 6820]
MYVILYDDSDGNKYWWNKVGLWSKRREQASTFNSIKTIKQHLEASIRNKMILFTGKQKEFFFGVNLQNNQKEKLFRYDGEVYMPNPIPNNPYVLYVKSINDSTDTRDVYKYYNAKENLFKINGNQSVSYYTELDYAISKAKTLGDSVGVFDCINKTVAWLPDIEEQKISDVDNGENSEVEKDIPNKPEEHTSLDKEQVFTEAPKKTAIKEEKFEEEFSLEKTKEAISYLSRALKKRLPVLESVQGDYDSKFEQDLLHAIEFEQIKDPVAFIATFKSMRKLRRLTKDEQALLSAFKIAFDQQKFSQAIDAFGINEDRKYVYRTKEIKSLLR